MFDKQSLVVQANKLIMSPQKFTYEEKRFLICLISKINPHDEDFKTYRINFSEYASFVGQDISDIRKTLPKVTRGIMTQILEIENEEEEEIYQKAIIIGSTHYRKYGFVEVKIHPDMKDVLLDLKERFTQYKLENAINMKSKNSIRLYEIIKANEFKEQKSFRLSWSNIPKVFRNEFPKEEIQKLLDTNYERFIDFERFVLKHAQSEMKKHTDICFEYKKVKYGRFVMAIDFFIQDNVPSINHNQMSLFEMTKDSYADADNDKTLLELAKEAEKTIENMDRGKLCREFQKAVKREYGFDFPLGLLEGVSNQKIVEILPSISCLGIIKRNNENSVIKYIQRVLNGVQ